MITNLRNSSLNCRARRSHIKFVLLDKDVKTALKVVIGKQAEHCGAFQTLFVASLRETIA